MFVFDAYGTLWDIQAIEEAVARVAGRARSGTVLNLWRQKQLEYAFLRTLMDRYEPFSEVTRQALSHTLAVCELKPSPGEEARLLDAWNHPTPFSDAKPLLQSLAGHRRFILSNGDPAMLDAGVQSSGLAPYLDGVLSVDRVRRYKPHPSTYQLVVDTVGIDPSRVVFVSSNGWDVAGAAHFGFRVIWVNRRGQIPEELSTRPWKVVARLDEIRAEDGE